MIVTIVIKTSIPASTVSVVKLLSKGYTLPEACEKLDLNVRTTEDYIDKLKKAYKCKTIAHLVAVMLRKKIIN